MCSAHRRNQTLPPSTATLAGDIWRQPVMALLRRPWVVTAVG